MKKIRRSEDIIAHARMMEKKRRGVRTKIRFPDILAARARACAKEVNALFGDWVCAACRQAKTYREIGVAFDEKTILATRSGSECITIRAPVGMAAKEVLTAVAMACEYCEQRAIKYNPQPVTRYILAKE